MAASGNPDRADARVVAQMSSVLEQLHTAQPFQTKLSQLPQQTANEATRSESRVFRTRAGSSGQGLIRILRPFLVATLAVVFHVFLVRAGDCFS